MHSQFGMLLPTEVIIWALFRQSGLLPDVLQAYAVVVAVATSDLHGELLISADYVQSITTRLARQL